MPGAVWVLADPPQSTVPADREAPSHQEVIQQEVIQREGCHALQQGDELHLAGISTAIGIKPETTGVGFEEEGRLFRLCLRGIAGDEADLVRFGYAPIATDHKLVCATGEIGDDVAFIGPGLEEQDEMVCTRAACEQVVPASADERVIACPAVEDVVARPALQVLRRGGAQQFVIHEGADDRLDVPHGQVQGDPVIARLIFKVQHRRQEAAEGESIRSSAAIELVRSRIVVAGEAVGSGAAEQTVVTFPIDQKIIAIPAGQGVIALTAREDVDIPPAGDRIVSGPA